MPTLLPEELESRRRGDAAHLLEIDQGDYPIRIRGFHSTADASTASNEVSLADEADPPSAFLVTCAFATLDERHQPLRGVTFLIDPNAGGDYPVTEPVARIVSKPVPFAPHIGFPSGAVCHGHFVWTALRTPLWVYVAQLCRLLNYDEPLPDGGFSAMNPAAVRHWAAIGHRPLDPDLGSPVASGHGAVPRVIRRAAAAATADGAGRLLRRAADDRARPAAMRGLRRVT